MPYASRPMNYFGWKSRIVTGRIWRNYAHYEHISLPFVIVLFIAYYELFILTIKLIQTIHSSFLSWMKNLIQTSLRGSRAVPLVDEICSIG